MIQPIRIAVLYGGRSAEHDVSILSAANVVAAIDQSRYEIVPIAVTRTGRWLLTSLEDGKLPREVPSEGIEVALLPGRQGGLLAVSPAGAPVHVERVAVLFPVLHGPFGEDGSVQGQAEVADVPYVGCGILGSAAAMDKEIAKRLLRDAGLEVAGAVALRRGDAVSFEDIAAKLGLPLFVKPARQGSSVGVGKVRDGAAFGAALDAAFAHDSKILVEACIAGREIECSVLEHADGRLTVSLPGEIIPAEAHGFYTYEAKYLDAAGAVVRIPADVPAAIGDAARHLAERAFRALECSGMARVDFFLLRDGSLLVNEVNTIPGFTDISMYPKALAAGGLACEDVVSALIDHAFAKHRARVS